MKVTIYLHGHLRNITPNGVFNCEVKTAEEAIRALTNQFPEFKPDINGRKVIKIKGFDTQDSLYYQLLVDELHIYPAFSVSKSKGMGMVLTVVGAVLVAVSAGATAGAYGGASAAATAEAGAAYWASNVGMFWSTVSSVGIAMMLSGIMIMLSPAPKLDMNSAGEDPNASKYLGAPKNTTAIGTRIMIGYGMYKVFGHYITFSTQATDVA